MISDFGFQEHIELLKLDVLLGTDFCQTRTTLRHFVAKKIIMEVPIIAAAYSTHKNEFYTFYLYIYVIMKLLRKVLKRKKKG